jgi:UDP-glucose 4-epimerase
VRAVVTGGAGFIGSHVVEALLARGDEAHVLDNLATGRRENVPEGARLHEADLRTDTDDVFAEARPDVCFHLGAQADVGTSVERPLFDAEVNVLGTLRVLEAARRHGTQVIFASTGGALYGECERPAREDHPRSPLAPYGASKLAAEEYLATWNRLHGTTHVTLRLGNVFGPRQLPSLEGGVIAIFMGRLARGDRVEIFGDGEQTRDFVFVADVADAMFRAVGVRGGTFNVATGIATSVNRVFELCRDLAGADTAAEYRPARPGDLRHSVIDASLAADELGWRPGHDLAAGLEKTWHWAVSGSRWCR